MIGLVVTLFLCGLFFKFVLIDQYSFRWRHIFAVNPEGFEIRGIDISHFQNDISWEHVRNANINARPVSFAFIKATEGKDLIDPNFNDNFYKARQNNVVRGAYHYFKPNTDARMQALFFIKQVHLEPGDLPPVLDVEEDGKLSKQKLQKVVTTWLNIVEKHYGVTPIIYTGYKFKMRYLSDHQFDRYPYWIAHYYVDQLRYQGSWLFWQYTDAGIISGIHGEVDCNIFNGTMVDFRRIVIPEDSTSLDDL